MLQGHGDDLYRYEDIRYNFSSNVPYLNNSKKILEYLSSQLDSLLQYPEPNGEKVASLLATLEGVPWGSVLVTNGSTEAFYLIAHYLQNENSLIVVPSFAEYQDSCQVFNHRIAHISIQSLSKEVLKGFSQYHIWLGLPNNPDGYILPQELLLELLNHTQINGKFLIVDTAYIKLCEPCLDPMLLMETYHHLIVVRSLTKTFALPGIRLGYIIAHPSIINGLVKYKMPWSVNSIALKAGEYIVSNYESLLPPTNELLMAQRNLEKKINTLGIETSNSATNYSLCTLPIDYHSGALKDFLAYNYRVLIRDASNFQSLSSRNFRVATQDNEANMILIDGLKDFITR